MIRFQSLRAVQPLPGLVLAGVFAAMGWVCRTQLIEPEAVALRCTTDGAPWWCAVRMAIIQASWWGGVGVVALGLAVVAGGLLWRSRRPAIPAMAALGVGGFGAALYHPTLSCLALVLAMLILIQDRRQKAIS